MEKMQKIIGKNIFRARTMARLSRKSMAELLGISESSLQSYESGKKYADYLLVDKISKSLNITRDFFYEEPDESEMILFHASVLNKKELDAIREFSRYKISGVPTIVYVLNLPIFAPPAPSDSENPENAFELGKTTAIQLCLQGDTLSESLEKIGIYVVLADIENPLFRGLLIIKEKIPIVVLYSKSRRENTFLEDLAHELGHIFLLNSKSDSDRTECLCDDFSRGFCESWNKTSKAIGKFDFLERMTVAAWKQEEISGSRAAEILGIKTGDFFLTYQMP